MCTSKGTRRLTPACHASPALEPQSQRPSQVHVVVPGPGRAPHNFRSRPKKEILCRGTAAQKGTVPNPQPRSSSTTFGPGHTPRHRSRDGALGSPFYPHTLVTAPCCEAWMHHSCFRILFPAIAFASSSPPAADHAALFLANYCMSRKNLVQELPSGQPAALSLVHLAPSVLAMGSFISAMPVRWPAVSKRRLAKGRANCV